MIGRACQYRDGAIELFGQHDPNQLVRPDRRAEGQHEIRLRQGSAVMAVSAPDAEDGFARTLIPPAFDLAGELAGGQGLAALIQQDQLGARLQGLGQGPAFIAGRFEGAIVDLGLAERRTSFLWSIEGLEWLHELAFESIVDRLQVELFLWLTLFFLFSSSRLFLFNELLPLVEGWN